MNTNSFNLNTLKGRLAEHLVQDLFINSGYNVFNYGLERIHPLLSKQLRNDNHPTSKLLRHMPDFVVQSTEDGSLFYLEVKFRASGEFGFEDHFTDYPFKNAWFVIVSPSKIQCMHYKRLSKGYFIKPSTNYSLSKVKSFHISSVLLSEYEQFAAELFFAYKK